MPSDGRGDLEARQLAALRRLLAAVVLENRFYGRRLQAAGLDAGVASVAEFVGRCPPTTKAEIVADQAAHPPWGTNLSFPLDRYVRFHQTSGTTGRPLRWLDTAESWCWMLDAWDRVFAAAGIGRGDRVFFPFSFGPFLGFWTAFDAASRRGCLAIPGGGMPSPARLRVIVDAGAGAVCCTPTYAVRLAEVASEEGIDLAASAVRAVIVAGEPGGGVAATRERIEEAWGARLFDHHGMTEVGPVSFPNPRHPGVLHVIEDHYLAEVVDPATLEPVAPGETGELLLTTLGRLGSPLLRYRTGDVVRVSRRPAAELGHDELALEGGILSRVDDMVFVRGVNLYPAALEAVVRADPAVVEYRVELRAGAVPPELRVELEPEPGHADPAGLARRVENALRDAFQIRIPVTTVPPGALPRFELKARRWVRIE